MKAMLCAQAAVLLATTLAATSAHADDARHLQPAEKAQKPGPTTKNDAKCDDTGQWTGAEQTVSRVRFALVYDCGMDAMGSMVWQVGDRYVSSPPVTVSHVGAHMTEAPDHTTLVADRLYAGRLGDASPGILRAVTTRSRAIRDDNGRVESEGISMEVQVCSLGAAPACAWIGRYSCGSQRCAAPSLRSGVVRVGYGAGKVAKVTIASE